MNNSCFLQEKLEGLYLQLNTYNVVGGGIYNDIIDPAVRHLELIKDKDFVLVAMGSNESRWIADRRYQKRSSTRNSNCPWSDLDNLFDAAKRSNGTLIITTPFPSPCHYRSLDKKNKWCLISPCIHEQTTAKACRRLKQYIELKAKEIPNCKTIDLTAPFTHDSDLTVNRSCFRQDNVHFLPNAAKTIDDKILNAVKRHLKGKYASQYATCQENLPS